jgi:hypothetical protein
MGLEKSLLNYTQLVIEDLESLSALFFYSSSPGFYLNTGDPYLDSFKVGRSAPLRSGRTLIRTPKSYKIFESSKPISAPEIGSSGPRYKSSAPLVRLDLEGHHGKPPQHIQFGKGEYTGREGSEAVEIFKHIVKSLRKK